MNIPKIYRSYLVFYVIVVLLRRLVSRHLIVMFDLSSIYYDVMFFIILLRCFICVRAIQTNKANSISQSYQFMVVSILNNWSQ